MIGRLRESIFEALHALSARLHRPRRPGRSAVKGCMQNVIVVKPPDPMFVQALFILKDDYFTNSALSSQELLMQAKDAARQYVDQTVPPARPRISPWLLIPLAALPIIALTILLVSKLI